MLLHKSEQHGLGFLGSLNLTVNEPGQRQQSGEPATGYLPGSPFRPCADHNPEKAKQYEITSFVHKKKPCNAKSQIYPYLTPDSGNNKKNEAETLP